MSEIRLGLNIIVGPEDKDVLDRCLRSCQGDLFDEIVITMAMKEEDVGIRALAEGYGANVYFFKWVEDFSAARNYSFSKATTEYIFWLDSDDIIKSDQYEELLKIKPDIYKWDIIILNYIYTHDDKDKPVLVLPRERIVKKCDYISWHDPIHEYLNLNVPHNKLKKFNINVDHYRVKPHNPSRNIDALRKVYESDKCSERIKFYFGKELADCGYWEEALTVLEPYIKTGKDFADNLTTACIRLSRYYLDKSDYASAKNYAMEGIRFNSIYAENYVLLGTVYENEKDLDTAALYYKEALNKKLEGGMSQIVDFYGFIPSAKLALLYYGKKDLDNSLKYCEKSLTYKTEDKQMNELLKLIKLEQKRLSKGSVIPEEVLNGIKAYLMNINLEAQILCNNIDYCDLRLSRVIKLEVVWMIPVYDVFNPSIRIRRININNKLNEISIKSKIIRDYYDKNNYEIRNQIEDASVVIFTQYSEKDLEIIKYLRNIGIKCVFDHCEALFGFPFERECMEEVDLITCCSTKLMELTNEQGLMHTVSLKDAVEVESDLLEYVGRSEKPRAVYMGMGGNSWLVNDWLKETIEEAGYELVTITEWDNATKKWGLTTWVNDMLDCDVALCPQRADVQPAKSSIKATTAMALGLPVLCSPIRAYKEIIEEGKNGFICDKKSDWYDALIKLKDIDLRKEIGQAGKKSVEKYSLLNIANEWKEVLFDLINNKLTFPEPTQNVKVEDRSIVDIIISSYNNVEYLKLCISSILMNTLYPFHIIISDGGSDDETWEYLNALKGITIVGEKGKRLSFSETCNAGIKASRTKYFVILNSDVIVSKSWLTNLVDKMDSTDRLASCGVLSNCDRGWKFQ
jgi:glycosyltransferase involved in cell wall biosynthesis